MSPRGITLIETMMAMVVAAIGITGAVSLATASSSFARRTQTQAQALALAQRQLEDITARGCNPDPAAWCNNVTALDGRTSSVWQSVDGALHTTAPAGNDLGQRRFDLVIDVDPPYEGTERGSPVIERPLAGASRGSVVNVRVTVSWVEPGRGRQVEALQTRMSP